MSRLVALVPVLMITTVFPSSNQLWAAEPVAWPVPEWEVATPESQGMSSAGLEKARDWLKVHGSKTGLVVRHGRIVAEWYFDDAKPTTQYLVFSTTKSFSATAAGIAISEGRLSLDTKVGDLLSDVSPSEKGAITVEQILSMTTGVHSDSSLRKRPDLFTYVLTEAPLDSKPGEKWLYNNTGLSLLTPLMLKATGKEISQYLTAKVFEPIGIQSRDWHWEQQEGHDLPFSGLHITARALARFGLLTLRNGTWQDKEIVPAAWVKRAAAPSQTMTPNYGFLWWNNSTNLWPGVPSDAFAAMGKFDNDMLIVPSLDLILIRQIGEDPEPNRKINKLELFKLVVEAVQQ